MTNDKKTNGRMCPQMSPLPAKANRSITLQNKKVIKSEIEPDTLSYDPSINFK
jgi:hypothetical protein